MGTALFFVVFRRKKRMRKGTSVRRLTEMLGNMKKVFISVATLVIVSTINSKLKKMNGIQF